MGLVLEITSTFQAINGLRITDSLLKRTYEFDDVCQVFVCENDLFMQSLGEVDFKFKKSQPSVKGEAG